MVWKLRRKSHRCETTVVAEPQKPEVVETIDRQEELFYDYERGEHLVSCQPSRMTRSYLNNVRSILRVRYLIVRLFLIGNGKRYRKGGHPPCSLLAIEGGA